MKIPCRPELGTLGVRVGVKTNDFRVVVSSEEFEVYRYVVSFSPECTLGNLRRKMIDKLEGCYAESLYGISLYYDGERRLYTKRPLNFQYKEFDVKLHKKMREKYKITVELDQIEPIIDGELPSDYLQAIEVVLSKKPSQSHEVVEKSFYDPSWSLRKDLGCGVDCWSGFTQSLRPTQMGLSLIIDKCAESFFNPIGVFEYVKTLYSFESGLTLPDMLIRKIARDLDGVRVQTTHDKFPKCYHISGVSQQPLSDLKFGNVKATEYLLKMHNVVIKYPTMPALQTNQVGKAPFYVPMELCQIVDGQQYTKRLTDSQLLGLSKITNQIPVEKEEDFKKVVQEYYCSQTGVYGPGIEIGSEFAFVEARVLPAPLLKYYEKAKEILIPHTDGERDPADLFNFFE